MVNKARVKIYVVQSRHTVNLPSDFVRDSAFPFKPGEDLMAEIRKGSIIIRRTRAEEISQHNSSSGA